MEFVHSEEVHVSLTLYGRITPDQPPPEVSIMMVRDGFMGRGRQAQGLRLGAGIRV